MALYLATEMTLVLTRQTNLLMRTMTIQEPRSRESRARFNSLGIPELEVVSGLSRADA